MKNLKKDLQAVTKEFDVLTKKTKKLTDELKKKAADQLNKAREAVKPEVARRTANTLKSLKKTIDKMIKAAEKFEKDQAAEKRKPKAKATRKVAVKKKAVAKKPTAKKTAAPTATDQVLKIIKRSKKGVDAPTLMKKTGFGDKKIRNILFRAAKQGKIKRTGRGVYIAS